MRISLRFLLPALLVLASGATAAPSADTSGLSGFTAKPPALQVPSGRTGRATVTVELPGAPTPARGDRLLKLWANLGSFGAITPAGPGRFTAVWSAPDLGFPTVVLMRAELVVGGKPSHRWLALPISIAMDLSVPAGRGDAVQIVIGAQDFGPVRAKVARPVKVPIVVPPTATSYTINRTDDYNVTKSETIRFGLPPFKRMAITGPSTAGAGEVVELEVFQIDARGVPYTYEASLVASCPDASLEEVIGRAAVQRLRIRLPGRAGPLTCRVFMKNDPKVIISHDLEVGTAQRLALKVEVSPERLDIDSGGSAKVTVSVSDLFGNVSDTDRLVVTVNGRPASLAAAGGGLYRGWIYAPSTRQPGDRLVVRATAPGARPSEAVIRLRGSIATRLSATVQPRVLQADGKRSVLVEVRAEDRHGMPANDPTVRVESEQGEVLFVHRVTPGFYRARFVPRLAPRGGEARVTVQTTRASPVIVAVRLRPIPQRLLLTPLVGAFGDFVRTVGVGATLRFEYGAYRGRPNVFVGAALLVSPHFSIEDGTGELIDHRGLTAGAVAHTRLRLLAAGRFGLDLTVDLGLLGLYASYRQRYQTLVQRNEDGRAAFTAAVGLEAGLVTAGRQEIFATLQARYLIGRFEDAAGRNRVVLFGGLGYRFPL